MKKNIITVIKLTLICIIFFSGVYTLIIVGVAQLVSNKGKGKVIISATNSYYENIGQSFTKPQYFHSRPSVVSYDAAASGASNKGAANPEYLATVQTRIDTFLVQNPEVNKSEIPVDLITASGSGLDPDISVQAAKVQVKRIAKIRKIPENTLYQLIHEQTEKPLFGLFGVEKINVLKLNLALEKVTL